MHRSGYHGLYKVGLDQFLLFMVAMRGDRGINFCCNFLISSDFGVAVVLESHPLFWLKQT